MISLFVLSTGNRHPVTSQREKNDLFNTIKQSSLDDHAIPRYWKVRSTTIVRRSDWQEDFHEKRLELKQTLKYDPKVTFAYGLVRKDSLADDICENGSFRHHQVHQGIGNVEKGVIVFSHPDVLTEWARKKRFENPSVIIYKVCVKFGIGLYTVIIWTRGNHVTSSRMGEEESI